MKWCVITTIGKNPGDEFIRIGVENIIKDIDKSADIFLIDKETPDIFKKHQFDKCVLAGMPVFWSYFNNNFWEIGWWKPITEYYSKDKNKFMIMGAGSFQNWQDINLGVNINRYKTEINNIVNKSWKITLRDNVPNKISNFNLDVLPCPAIFSTKNYNKVNDLKLCNIMPIGGHYTEFDSTQSNIWRNIISDVCKILQEKDFIFIAHNSKEEQFAKHMNWKNIISYNGNPESLLPYYKDCVKYFGNRIHGAIVAKSVNADVLSCGFDSRQEATKLVGCTSLLPSQLSLDELEKWTTKNLKQPVFNFEIEFKKQKNIVKEFKNK